MKSLLRCWVLLVLAMVFNAPEAAADGDDWLTFPYNLGGGLEMNMNTKEGWAQGFLAMVDRHINPYLVLGIKGTMNNDYGEITSSDGGLLARLYVFKLGSSGAFTQLGGGISIFQEDERRGTTFMLNYGVGYRLYFMKGFFAEAYVQAGYPFQWGVGIVAGHWFNF